MKKLRFAFVGCGSISRKHAESIKRLDNTELACVADIDGELSRRVGRENSVPFYTDIHHMAKNEKIDIFTILTSSGTHGEIIKELAPYKKDFLVEKPLGIDVKTIGEAINICDRKKLKLFVVHQNRLNKPIRALRNAMDNGRFSRLILGTVRVRWTRKQEYYDAKKWRGTWKFDGGVLENQANHHVDMLLWLMGSVESVMAMEDTKLLNIETPNTACVVLRFTSGALGIIEATTATRPFDLEGSISILGERGSVEVGGYFMNELKTWHFSEKDKIDDTVFEEYRSNPDIFAWNHTEYIREVANSVLKGKGSPVDGIEAQRTVELIDAINESAKTKKEIYLNKKYEKDACVLVKDV